MAVSHLSWLKRDKPKEIIEYWRKNYPEIRHINENKKIIKDQG
ncbi:hypothetical protein [Marinitoga sp. 38H-ov]|nr:hypothetical protein [Marinitoga sp. 38H-ov]